MSSDDKKSNPVMGVITFGPAKDGMRAETITDPTGMQPIDVPSLMRTAGWDEGLEAAAKKIESVLEGHDRHDKHSAWAHCEDFGCGDLRDLIEVIRAMKSKP